MATKKVHLFKREYRNYDNKRRWETACGLGARSAAKVTTNGAKVTCAYCLKHAPKRRPKPSITSGRAWKVMLAGADRTGINQIRLIKDYRELTGHGLRVAIAHLVRAERDFQRKVVRTADNALLR